MGEGRVSSEGIADLNPEDIESISVLAGPSAAALYGSNAANGAILITTKKGKEGRVDISFSSSADFSSPLLMPEFQTQSQPASAKLQNVFKELALWGRKV